MDNMVYTSNKGKKIVFDDYVDNTEEYNIFYVEMCRHCHNKYRGILGTRADDGGIAMGTCSVKGCDNEAHYYVDFDKSEVKFV